MSYEGYMEFICESGHYSCVDVYVDAPKTCECGNRIKYYHMVDETNGIDYDYPDTCPGAREEIGYDDIWHEDHYGNKYATKRLRYKPVCQKFPEHAGNFDHFVWRINS